MSTLLNRIGSANTYDSAIRNIAARQSALSNLQENLTSGKRVVRPSDDPTAAANAERALNRLSRIATDQRALDAQSNAIRQAESTLGTVVDVLQKFRELTVSAGNGINSAFERKSIAMEMQGLRDQIFSLANTTDTNGLPLFSALGSALQPFVGPVSTAPDYSFKGLPGQAASNDVSIPFTVDGDAAFMLQTSRDGVFNVQLGIGTSTLKTDAVVVKDPAQLTPGSSYAISNISPPVVDPIAGTSYVTYDVKETLANGLPGATLPTQRGPDYPSIGGTIAINISNVATPVPPLPAAPLTTPGLSFNIIGTPVAGDSIKVTPSPSLFSVLDNAIRDIGSASSSNSASQAVSQALHNIDIGMSRVSAVRGQAGDLLNRADRIASNQQGRSIQLEADRSNAEDLDVIKGISDFNNQQTGYSAALQTYAKVQQLSLFNYIS
ncbi:flagellar hook-associated protein FlgL [Rhodoferax antarcticus]|uniref:Flagellar hook-associated protein 3 n=1 Tax=Rhodoferax antarcticus ANT.BR TaxID=1111071 RepID=A0A1Q8YG95_9BURK|nr:flagellar hook-associated protein FlgL [Rhodoferax antarcticus]APW45587.1 flagellar hook-associated protein 3 [Rhodoferax antarcticus]OLP07074.1 flagellar hook-associated protein 3 [Rhodoferax antarcticus ANT.BR]